MVSVICCHLFGPADARGCRGNQHAQAKKLADLQTAIAEQTDRVIAELEERHRKLGTITISSIRAREEARLDQVLDSFYSTTQKLVNDFTSIVHEDVKSQ